MKPRPYLATCAICLFTQAVSAETYTAEVWADNWFQVSINGVKVAEDSVPITTERSFNAERFSFDAELPFSIGLMAMDFKENNSGLEYIGSRRQQMGDGGVIAQIRDSKGELVATTDDTWQCLVTHEAPLDKSCADEENPVAGEGSCGFNEVETPTDWTLLDFDDSNWANAQVYSKSEVRPKDGYDRINWAEEAKLIWGPDLETDNTLLCRMVVK
jgi:hypothetical protein